MPKVRVISSALLGMLLANTAVAGVYVPSVGAYVDQYGDCIAVVKRSVIKREFILNSGDRCKPGLQEDIDGDVISLSEEKTFRCVANMPDGTWGYWGTLHKGGLTIEGDTTFAMKDTGLHSQQTLRFSEPAMFFADTTGACSAMVAEGVPPPRLKSR